MRDVSIIPLSSKEEIIVGTDNSGGIGTKEEDVVKVDDRITAYYSTRVAVMEVLAVNAAPFSVIIHNFSGDPVWEAYKQGAETALKEAELEEVTITGSTESNFSLKQSALGITVLGKRPVVENETAHEYGVSYAVIGAPLTGNQVLEKREMAAPLSLFTKCCRHSAILDLIPVGSKGILEELRELTGDASLTVKNVECPLDILVSGGPSTCFLVKFRKEEEGKVREFAGGYYHSLLVRE
ncbi:ATP-binding protein [Bacillus haikouensis]|uniref:ATP-binding protein n=1 Tax=Bacillus haikouensis TaxID=1510468 RepID=UPI001555F82D|nr:ATP-binding protein [Bacillus haikouensis]NQD65827.1 ATP-binding protein [Bacillus haikouensis]